MSVDAPANVSRVAKGQPLRDGPRTRTAILDAAERIFARDGLRAARTQQIADECGITKAMIHYYFETKEKLYEAVLDRVFQERSDGMDFQSLRRLPPSEALSAFLDRLLAQMCRKPHVGPLFALENIQNVGVYYRRRGGEIYRVLTDIVQRGVREGLFEDVDSRHASIIIMGACVHYFNAANNTRALWPESGQDGRRAEEHAALTKAMILRSVFPRKRSRPAR